MCDSLSTPTRRELVVAVVGGMVWAAVGLAISGWSSALAQAAPCRIHNHLTDGTANVGSGTLIDVTANGERGLVLTCAHLFAEGTGRVVVEFVGGQTHGALVVAVDRDADLAALEIAKPQAAAASLRESFEPTGGVRACGFGPSGEYRCVEESVLGYSEGAGRRSLRISGAVRSGDSGGGVFDEQGRLTAVVWGAGEGVTYASTGRPLAAFLDRVLGPRRAGAARPAPVVSAAGCVGGRCPLVRPGVVGGAPAGSLPAADGACPCAGQLAAIRARLDGLERTPLRGDLGAAPSPVFGGAARALATLATAVLGVSGPAGWGVIAAATVGGWLIGRRRKALGARRKALVDEVCEEHDQSQQLGPSASRPAPSQEATAAAVDSFPIERDDREARELLRLSQLEGRDPLQDAVAGRLALDRLDALAEGDADPQHASWADRLRRELRERFNEIAPTKFQVSNSR